MQVNNIAYQSALPNNLLGIDNVEGFAGSTAGGQIKAQNYKPAMRLDISSRCNI